MAGQVTHDQAGSQFREVAEGACSGLVAGMHHDLVALAERRHGGRRRRSCSGPTLQCMGARGGVLLMAVGWILLGVLVWVVGIFGIARGLEDRCLLVADEGGYGASTQTSSVWPPRFTCELSGPDGTSETGTVEVSQPAVALLRSGWTLGFPIAWLVLGALVLVRQTSQNELLPTD